MTSGKRGSSQVGDTKEIFASRSLLAIQEQGINHDRTVASAIE